MKRWEMLAIISLMGFGILNLLAFLVVVTLGAYEVETSFDITRLAWYHGLFALGSIIIGFIWIDTRS